MKKILFLLILLNLLIPAGNVLAQTSSGSGDIREKVQEKVQAALNKPKAYMGTVTDIAESSLQLKNLKGEIKQVSVNKDITVANIISDTKEVKFSDVAIGDFIVAMGYVNPISVLDTKRILVTSSPSTPNRKTVFIKVETFAKNTGVGTTIKDDQKINFSTNSKTKYFMKDEEEITQAKATSLKASSRAIITGVEQSGTITVRKVLVLQ